MSLVAGVENGKIVESASQSSLKKAEGTGSSDMDKEAFLQLLVAQMKYQDPLQPTSNTEYISQYAQFSQVEQMQNMAASTDLARASSLVGQQVYVKTTSSSGETNYIQGKVDYVVYENGEAYLAIDESLYSLNDLDTVVDAEYIAAYDKAYEFTIALNKLPNINGVDLNDASTIDDLKAQYDEMTDYEKLFVADETVENLNKYVARIEELRKALEESKGNGENGDETGNENGDEEGTENVE